MIIKDLRAIEILDSRGNPTILTKATLENGDVTRFRVPSGASTGQKEALELRDNDPNRYLGKGVSKAVENINNIIKKEIVNKEFNNIKEVDEVLLKLDNSDNKSILGANALLSVSGALLLALAKSNNKEVYEYVGDYRISPKCFMNILNGGSHADNNISFQEFMIVPNKDTVKENVKIGSEIFHTLKSILKKNNYNTNVGDEGGFAPNLSSNEEALKYITKAIEEAGYIPGEDVSIALDVAASEFYRDGKYEIEAENLSLTADQLLEYYSNLINKFPIISIEDPFDEYDYESFSKLNNLYGDKIQVVGDDLFTTNMTYLKEGISKNAANSILIKMNQIGTISETIDVINYAKANNYKTMISHRSGETEDTTIADLAVGLGLLQIKTGSLSRSDRTSKYNRLIEIEDDLENNK